MSATIQGTNGACAITGYASKINQWSANIQIKVVETTGFSDGGFRTREPVQIFLEGSAAGTLTYGDAAGPAPTLSTLASLAPVSITLTATTGKTFTFSAVVTGISITRPVDGKADVTFNFKSAGPVTQTW